MSLHTTCVSNCTVNILKRCSVFSVNRQSVLLVLERIILAGKRILVINVRNELAYEGNYRVP